MNKNHILLDYKHLKKYPCILSQLQKECKFRIENILPLPFTHHKFYGGIVVPVSFKQNFKAIVYKI